MTCEGKNVWDAAQLQKSKEGVSNPTWLAPVVVAIVFLLSIVSSVLGFFFYRYIKFSKVLNRYEWAINVEELLFYTTTTESSGRKRFVSWPSVNSLTDIEEIDEGYHMLNQILQWPAKLHGQTVGLRLLEIKDMTKQSRDLKALLLSFKSSMFHDNVLTFHGLTEIQGENYVVGEYCSRGTLSEVLQSAKIEFNKDFKFSLSLDIAHGLQFLHSKSIVHGHLRSMCCFLDVKWCVKIADWEYTKIYSQVYKKKNPLLPLRKNPDVIGQNEASYLDFWMAPEILREDFKTFPSVSSDTYSLGVIINEIFTRQAPYSEHRDNLTYLEVLKAVIQNNLRPKHGEFTATDINHIIDKCWEPDPHQRPSLDQVIKCLLSAHRLVKSFFLNL